MWRKRWRIHKKSEEELLEEEEIFETTKAIVEKKESNISDTENKDNIIDEEIISTDSDIVSNSDYVEVDTISEYQKDVATQSELMLDDENVSLATISDTIELNEATPSDVEELNIATLSDIED